jgi:hypothetical protein
MEYPVGLFKESSVERKLASEVYPCNALRRGAQRAVTERRNLAAGACSRELAGGERSPSSTHATGDERHDEQDKEYEEQNFRNACGACCDAAEAEQRRY